MGVHVSTCTVGGTWPCWRGTGYRTSLLPCSGKWHLSGALEHWLHTGLMRGVNFQCLDRVYGKSCGVLSVYVQFSVTLRSSSSVPVLSAELGFQTTHPLLLGPAKLASDRRNRVWNAASISTGNAGRLELNKKNTHSASDHPYLLFVRRNNCLVLDHDVLVTARQLST
jgi:hypothetical protein